VSCGPDPLVPPETLTDTTDPEHGVFTLEQALDGLPEGSGPLRAFIDTDAGMLTCILRPDKADAGVTNFVGLARGKRPFKDPKLGAWVKRRFYDGLLFHRVIPDFVAQGGDPLGTGYGGPGYSWPIEISDLTFDAGTLAFANTGAPNSNGSQFFITETDQPSLEGKYTIIGSCEPLAVVTGLTHVPTDANDKPIDPLPMLSVVITRCP
jgi:peptidyl-prolyl cis-trans isomerase A (cyclophilin A)